MSPDKLIWNTTMAAVLDLSGEERKEGLREKREVGRRWGRDGGRGFLSDRLG